MGKNIEMIGLPTTKREDIIDIVTNVEAALGIEGKRKDIATTHCVSYFKAGLKPSSSS